MEVSLARKTRAGKGLKEVHGGVGGPRAVLRAQRAPTRRKLTAHGPVPGPVSTPGGTAEVSLQRGKGVQITSKGRKEGKERHRQRLQRWKKATAKETEKPSGQSDREKRLRQTEGEGGQNSSLGRPGDKSRT